MKVTFIGTLPPIKAISYYCYFLVESLSKIVDLEFIGFKEIIPEFLYSGGTKAKNESTMNLKNVEIRMLIRWDNPISWVKTGLQCTGEVVHLQHWAYYSSVFYCVILPILKMRGKKIVLTIHNITPHMGDIGSRVLDQILNKLLFRFADIFIVHNQRNKQKFMELYNIGEERIFIVTHGALKPFGRITGVSQSAARDRFHISDEKKVMLYFGYMWEYKGVDDLLHSLVFIKQQMKDVLLVMAGQPIKNWERYDKIIKENDLDEHVMTFLGYIPDSDIEYYFSCADIVVLPYKLHPFDTHGGVGALAIFFKKPVVVTDVGGLPEYVKDERAIAKPNNPQDISAKLINVLKDKNLLQKLSKDSEQLSTELNWEFLAEKTCAIYEKMLK